MNSNMTDKQKKITAVAAAGVAAVVLSYFAWRQLSKPERKPIAQDPHRRSQPETIENESTTNH